MKLRYIIPLLLIITVGGSYLYSDELQVFYIRSFYRYIRRESPEESLAKVRELYNKKEYKKLFRRLDNLILIYPGNVRLRVLKGRALMETGQKSEGSQMLASLYLDHGTLPVEIDVIEVLFAEGEFDVILKLLPRLKSRENEYLDHIFGVSYYYTGDMKRAVHYLKKALQQGRREYDTYYFCGLALEKAGNPVDSAGYLEKAFRLDPLKKEAREALIRVYGKTGQYSKAGRMVRRNVR